MTKSFDLLILVAVQIAAMASQNRDTWAMHDSNYELCIKVKDLKSVRDALEPRKRSVGLGQKNVSTVANLVCTTGYFFFEMSQSRTDNYYQPTASD